ncbi:CidA/LrgA family protein [Aquabacter sp. CN5-332]|uniref:CidA/LrgA family protein n=1 Tax=Aquabacter sp. CN5-332 TaxID=3156608 RepID=UPI0032B4757F
MAALSLSVRSFLHRAALLQVVVLAGFWFVGDLIVRALGLPVPGGVVGMVLLLGLMAAGWVRPASVRLGAYWLLAEMLLFFVPAVIGVIDHAEFAGALGLKIAVVILTGTMLVMAGTALTVDLLYRWKQRHVAG